MKNFKAVNNTVVTEVEVCKAYEIVTGKNITEVTPEVLNECKGLDAEINPVTRDNIEMISASKACEIVAEYQKDIQKDIVERAQKFCEELSQDIKTAAEMGKTNITVNVLSLHRDVVKQVMKTIGENGYSVTNINAYNFVINW